MIPDRDDPNNYTAKQIYKNVGYYPSQKEALTALAEYNKNPSGNSADKITLGDLYDMWYAEHSLKVGKSSIRGYNVAHGILIPILEKPLSSINLGVLEDVLKNSDKNQPIQQRVKIVLGLMYDYAVKHEILPASKREMIRYIDVSGVDNPNTREHTPFTTDEIDWLWKHAGDVWVGTVLMLIYTGVRIGELLELKKSDVHLDEQWFHVGKSKTPAGVRDVPIADKILPLMQYWMSTDGEYLLNIDGKKMSYAKYHNKYFTPALNGMEHTPHDTRHTCVSLLVAKNIDDRIVKKIVGHAGKDVTESVYTHVELDLMLEAINKI